jgi:hypothetical protein
VAVLLGRPRNHHAGARIIAASTRRTHRSAHFHRHDCQIPACRDLHVRAAARAQQDQIVHCEVGVALPTVGSAFWLIELQPRALDRSSGSDQLETEFHGIDYHSADSTDLHTDTSDRSTSGVLTHGINNALRDR